MKSKVAVSESNHTQHQCIQRMTYTSIFAAIITLTTAYILHFPIGTNGGYIHFGDSIIYLAASLLPTPYALAAAAIGAGVADLLTAPVWAPATIIIKMLMVCSFTNRNHKIVNVHNVIATILAFFINGTGYFIAESILMGSFQTGFLASLFGGSLIQSGGSAIVFIFLGLFLDKMNFKKRFL